MRKGCVRVGCAQLGLRLPPHAAQPLPPELGTLDAIHLATALLWRETMGDPLSMATHDVALGIAAEAHGLTVLGEEG